MEALAWSQVLGWRMRRQFLDGAVASGAVAVVRRLAGVQAQVASAAELAVAVRGASPAEITPALWESRTLVKTWAMRGTLHLLPTDQAPAFLALAATIRNWEKPAWQREFKATPADLEAIAGAAEEAFRGGAPLTREELTTAVLDRTGSVHLKEVLGSGWGTVLKPLAWWGVLCYGPSRGKQVTFTAPPWSGLPPVEEAARVVIRAYLGAHGPATPEMFDNWLMRRRSRKTDLRGWFEAAAEELTTVTVEGVEMYALRAHVAELLDAVPSEAVRLLGGFDQYVLGAGTDAAYLIPAEHRSRVSRTAGWISPVVVHRGRVAGVWGLEDGRIKVEAFSELPESALQEEISRSPASAQPGRPASTDLD